MKMTSMECGCLAIFLLHAPGAIAQDQLASAEALKLLEALAATADPIPYTSVLGVPSGSVAPVVTAFVSTSGTTSEGADGGNGDLDGSLAFGLGIGELAGIRAQVSASIASVSPDDFGDSGSLTVKLGTTLPTEGSDLLLGLAVSGLAGWGDAEGGEIKTSAAVSSRNVVYLKSGSRLAYAWSFGVGDKVAENDTFGAFGGVSVGVTPNFGVSTAYDARGVDVGASCLVPNANGLSLSVMANDVFDTDTALGITASAAYSLSLF